MNKLRYIVLGAVLVGLFVLIGSAATAHPGKPDHIWRGPTPDPPMPCVQVYAPVHDVHGDTHFNWCYAVNAGVRIAWNGEAH